MTERTSTFMAGLLSDLAASPDRIRGSLEITAQVMIVTLLCMAMKVPESALACYMVFFAWHDNRGEAIFTAIKLTLAATLAIAVAAVTMRHVVDDPMARLFFVAGFTLLGMYLSQATRIGPMAASGAFVLAFALTLYDVMPIPELVTRGLTWIWIVLALPMAVIACWGALFGASPVARAKARIQARREAMTDPRGDKALALLDEGMAPVDEYLKFAKMLKELPGPALDALAKDADDSYYRLALAEAGASLQHSDGAPKPEKEPFFVADAFTNPQHVQFAMKVLLAVLITYGFYTAFGMFEIHTAMITCFYVAMGSRGEMHQRIVLRLTGCFLGAAVGAVVLKFLTPHMTDVGQLMVMVGAVSFSAAWIGLGSERISYAGWQMALCFFLVVLNGFAPQTDFAAASDRIVGILIGSGVMWAVFAAFWPVSSLADATLSLARFNKILQSVDYPSNGRAIADLRAPLAKAIKLNRAAFFEDHMPRMPLPINASRDRYYSYLRRGSND